MVAMSFIFMGISNRLTYNPETSPRAIMTYSVAVGIMFPMSTTKNLPWTTLPLTSPQYSIQTSIATETSQREAQLTRLQDST